MQTINAPDQCHKALGVHWHTTQDTLHVATPILDSNDRPTKRQVASDVARTFDIMGWFAPSIIQVKILLQKLWQLRIDWDQLVPDDIAQCWRKELPHLTQYPVPRCYYTKDKGKISTQLHGFCDASQQAYAGAVYVRAVYEDTTTTVTLVIAKTKVAPLSGSTIPRLELCGALLLSKLLQSVREALNLPLGATYAWTDSSIVLS